MKKELKFILFIVGLIVIIFVIAVLFGFKSEKVSTNTTETTLSSLDQFAECISVSGAKLYGAFWCSHCNGQKKAFGSSAEYLTYVECSTSYGGEQTQACKDANIEAYPTWIFADGTQLLGELPFETLSEKTNCALPSTD